MDVEKQKGGREGFCIQWRWQAILDLVRITRLKCHFPFEVKCAVAIIYLGLDNKVLYYMTLGFCLAISITFIKKKKNYEFENFAGRIVVFFPKRHFHQVGWGLPPKRRWKKPQNIISNNPLRDMYALIQNTAIHIPVLKNLSTPHAQQPTRTLNKL